MIQYVKIQERFERFEELENTALKIEVMLPDIVTTTREYPRGYSGKADGVVTLNVKGGVAALFGDTIRDMVASMLKEKKAKGTYPLTVELDVENTDEGVNMIFRMPDIWVKMDVPSASEALKSAEKAKKE